MAATRSWNKMIFDRDDSEASRSFVDRKDEMVDNERPKIRAITSEPILIGTSLCFSITSTVTVDLILRQACRSYGASMDECSADSTLEDKAQTVVANIQAANMVIMNVVPVFLCMIIGPWSDTNGRKPFLILAVIGQLVQAIAYAILASIESLDPSILTVPSVFQMITGGQSSLLTLAFCCFSDGASGMNRTFRMGLGMAGTAVASTLGPLLGNWLYNGGTYWGYITVYVASSSILFLVFLYTVFSLPETVHIDEEKKQKFFTAKHLLGIFNFFKRKRPARSVLLMSLICLTIYQATTLVASELEVYYLSLKKKLEWDVDQYSKFLSFYQGISCIYMTVVLWFLTSFLKIPDALVLSAIIVISGVGMIVFATANTTTVVYIANVLVCAVRLCQPVYKSMFTKVVSAEETGAALTVATAVEILGMPVSSIIYARIYALVVSSNPFEVYYFPASIALTGAITALVINFLQPPEKS